MATNPNLAATPRLYSRHARHARRERMRYSNQKINFLDQQAERLGTTEAVLFEDLEIGANRFHHEGAHETPGDTAERIAEEDHLSDL